MRWIYDTAFIISLNVPRSPGVAQGGRLLGAGGCFHPRNCLLAKYHCESGWWDGFGEGILPPGIDRRRPASRAQRFGLLDQGRAVKRGVEEGAFSLRALCKQKEN